MKNILALVIFFSSVSGFAESFGFPECVSWFKQSTNMSPKASHFLCSRGNPLSVAHCVNGAIVNHLPLSAYDALLLCDRGNLDRVSCAKTLKHYYPDYIIKVCNPEKQQTAEDWSGF